MLDDFEAAVDSCNIDAINRLHATFPPFYPEKPVDSSARKLRES